MQSDWAADHEELKSLILSFYPKSSTPASYIDYKSNMIHTVKYYVGEAETCETTKNETIELLDGRPLARG